MKLKDLIYQYRMEHGLSMDQFAKRCGVSKAYISIIESGRNRATGKPVTPTLITIKQLSDGMDMSLDDLLRSLDSLPISLSREDPAVLQSAKEDQMLTLFRKLNAAGQDKLIDSAEDLVASGRYIYEASGTHDH